MSQMINYKPILKTGVMYICTHRLKEEATNRILKYKLFTNTKETFIVDSDMLKREIVRIGNKYFLNLTLGDDNRLTLKDCRFLTKDKVIDIFDKKPVVAPNVQPVQQIQPTPPVQQTQPVNKPVVAPIAQKVVENNPAKMSFGDKLDSLFSERFCKDGVTPDEQEVAKFIADVLSNPNNRETLRKCDKLVFDLRMKGTSDKEIEYSIQKGTKSVMLSTFLLDEAIHAEIFSRLSTYKD